jgi:hypothetical protein
MLALKVSQSLTVFLYRRGASPGADSAVGADACGQGHKIAGSMGHGAKSKKKQGEKRNEKEILWSGA